MKYLVVFLFSISFCASAQNDEQLVKDVILQAYVGGIHNGGPLDDIRKGFHPSFTMLVLRENNLNPVLLEDWITNLTKARQEGTLPKSKAEAKFTSVTVSGTTANVVLDLYRDNKKLFTDNLLLYKFNEGWRIVTKTFYRYP